MRPALTGRPRAAGRGFGYHCSQMAPSAAARAAPCPGVPGGEFKVIIARDGTRPGYQVRGQGPCLVLANGLGGTFFAFRFPDIEGGIPGWERAR